MNSRRPHILVVEDNVSINEALTLLFEGDFHLTHASTAESALALPTTENFSVVLLDINLGTGMNGLQALPLLSYRYPEARIAIIGANSGSLEKSTIFAAGATIVLPKPWNARELLEIVQWLASYPVIFSRLRVGIVQ